MTTAAASNHPMRVTEIIQLKSGRVLLRPEDKEKTDQNGGQTLLILACREDNKLQDNSIVPHIGFLLLKSNFIY